jgi:hypothetical protein
VLAPDVRLVDGLRSWEADLSACRGLVQQESDRVHEQETAEARKQLEILHEQEKDVWAKAGGLLADLATAWNAYVEHVEPAHRLARVNGLEGSDALAVSPGPNSFREFLDLLLTGGHGRDSSFRAIYRAACGQRCLWTAGIERRRPWRCCL